MSSPISKTACINPWNTVVVRPNGDVLACCHATGSLGSVYTSSLDDIWNGEPMRRLRQALAQGEEPSDCRDCWKIERAGGRSPRDFANVHAAHTHPGQLERVLAQSEPISAVPPSVYILSLGNVCNLKCRSCNPVASSRIAADAVHRTWYRDGLSPAWRDHGLVLVLGPKLAEGVTYHGFATAPLRAGGDAAIEIDARGSRLRAVSIRAASVRPCRLRIRAEGEVVGELELRAAGELEELILSGTPVRALRLELAVAPGASVEIAELELRRESERRKLDLVPAGHTPFFRDVEALVASLTRRPHDAMVILLGGEPFMIDEIWEVAEELCKRGLSRRLMLTLITNGTMQRPELARLAPHFRHVVVSLSMDGLGPLFEYLRHGAKWDELQRTLAWLRSLANVTVVAVPTVQNYNVLDLVPVLRFLDERKIPFVHQLLTHPPRLSILNLPPPVRREAAARLRIYASASGNQQRRIVQSFIGVLDGAGDEFDAQLFREFMLYTNDLDSTRDERLVDVCPELVELCARSGVEWTTDRHLA